MSRIDDKALPSPATPSGAPEPAHFTFASADHGPGCSCCDCLEADAWHDAADRARWDELNEARRP